MNLNNPELWLVVATALGVVAGFLVFSALAAYRMRQHERLAREAIARSVRVPESIARAVERVLQTDFVRDGRVEVALERGRGSTVFLLMNARYKIINITSSAKDYILPFGTQRFDMAAERGTLASLRINGERVDASSSYNFVIEPGLYASRSLGRTIPINPGESASIEFATRTSMQDRDSLTWITLYPTARLKVLLRWDQELDVSIETLAPDEVVSEDKDAPDGVRSFYIEGLLPGQGFLLSWIKSAASSTRDKRT